MNTEQPEALRREYRATMPHEILHLWAVDALACIASLEAQLEAIGAGGISPLIAGAGFDAAALVLKAPDDLAAIIANRVTAEQQRQEAERERIRAEEAAKLQREEEKARLEAERKRIRFEELHRLQQETAAQARAELDRQRAAEESAENERNQALALTQQAQAAIKVDDVVDAEVPHGAVLPVAATPTAHIISLLRDDPEPVERTGTPTLKLGAIADRLGFTLTADFLKSLGFEPAATDRASKLYFEADFPLILAALVRHIEQVQARAAA